jgi:hypothetical protein
MTAPDKIYAWLSMTKPQGVSFAGGRVGDEIEYTRTASIPAPGAEYTGLFKGCKIDLRGAGYLCAFKNEGASLGVYNEGDKILCDNGVLNFDGLHILSDAALAARDDALSARPTDTRVVTVAQLERFARVAVELGDVVTACEINAIIGGQDNE